MSSERNRTLAKRPSVLLGLPQGYGPVLIGMRGSGKSSVGPVLAELLAFSFIDADAELERQTGRTIAEIFREDGAPYFRQLERQLLLDDLLRRGELVLATGGGAVLDAEVCERLRARYSVWLHAPLPVLAQRIDGSARPSLTGRDSADELAEVFAARESLYRAVAALVVDTEQHGVVAAAKLIVATLKGPDRA